MSEDDLPLIDEIEARLTPEDDEPEGGNIEGHHAQ